MSSNCFFIKNIDMKFMKRWVVRLSGGIGNQLFMYAFAKYLEQKYDKEVAFDLTAYVRSASRKPEILLLAPSLKRHDVRLNDVACHGVKEKTLKLLMRAFSSYSVIDFDDIVKNGCGLELDIDRKYYIKGFFQTSRYADWLRANSPGGFSLQPHGKLPLELGSIMDAISDAAEPVSVHIRRGDYTQKWARDRYLVCTADYYNRAISILKGSGRRFFFFSDDIDWVKRAIDIPADAFFVPNHDVNTFWYIWLMSKCRHNIISNSTFSWWGAYLNAAVDKTVIAPSVWLRGSDFSLNQSGWTIIDVK